jgi:hypothetical protein
MKLKKTGIVIIVISLLYLILVSWLASWWYVPDYRTLGPEFISGSSWYTSLAFNIIWSASLPLGAILLVLGFALYIRIERNRILFYIIASLIIIFWLGMWYVSSITSILFGIGGGIIIICFSFSVWNWAKKRPHLNRINRLAADIRLLGYLFFVISAWYLCGLLGTPMFGLRPEIMLMFKTQYGAYTLAAKIMICLMVAWILIAVSHYIETTSNKELKETN